MQTDANLPAGRSLAGKVAVVAGGGSVETGISNGMAASIAYARAGATVFVIDREAAAAQIAVDAISAEGNTAYPVVANMTDPAAVDRAFDTILALGGGGIDVLHNNIGVMLLGGVCDIDADDWDRVFNINLKPIFLACKRVVPVMLEQGGGVITNIGSIAAKRYTGLPMIAYAASKSAIPSITRTIAMQYGPQGIRANCIHPGIIDTPMQRASTDGAYANVSDDESARHDIRQARAKKVALNRLGDGFDVADVAVFLASDAARYVTGSELYADGGFLQM